MKKIAYYISDYGFGHATRSIAMIEELLIEDRDVEIIICHSFALDFLKSSLKNSRIKYRDIQTDIGFYLKDQSTEPDREKLNLYYDEFIKKWPDMLEREVQFLRNVSVDLVISDITPLAFEAAYKASLPSIGISNFTWYTAYQGLIDEDKLAIYKEAFEKMSFFFSLAGSKEIIRNATKEFGYDFYSRKINSSEVNRIKNLLNPEGNYCIIYFGLGMKISVNDLETWPLWDSKNCVFIVSSNMRIKKNNVFQIPSSYNDSQNFIAAADLAISKAGWGTVSESVLSKTPILIMERESMNEDRNTISFLKEHKLCKTVTWTELQSFTITKEFMAKIKESTELMVFKNEANEIATHILHILKEVNYESTNLLNSNLPGANLGWRKFKKTISL